MHPEVLFPEPFLDLVLDHIPPDVHAVLDVGGGRGVIGALCRVYRRSIPKLVALEIYPPYVQFLRSSGWYTQVHEYDLGETPLPFENREFDVAVCLEVVEHLSKEVGFRLIRELMRVARKVLISTPSRFFEQPTYDGNTYQRHISHWGRADLKQFGFRVYGIGRFTPGGHELHLGRFRLSEALRCVCLPTGLFSRTWFCVYP